MLTKVISSALGLSAILLSALLFGGCGPAVNKKAKVSLLPAASQKALDADFDEAALKRIRSLSPLPPVPADPTNQYSLNDRAARLGQFLFFDPKLSANGQVSCATCHDPERQFSLAVPLAVGIKETLRHPPVLWNLAYGRWSYWDGRRDSLWAQALAPLEEPGEMGTTRASLLAYFSGDADLSAAYREVFGELPSVDESPDRFFANVGKAIAAYEMKLISRDAPFDDFVVGVFEDKVAKIEALSASAQRGLAIFVGRGECTNCHHGPNFSDREFHNIGLDRGPQGKLDLGRYEGVSAVLVDPFNGRGQFSDAPEHAINDRLKYVTQKDNNLGEFKTPTLRNVALSAPYMHDGRFATLAAVIDFYSELDQVPALGHREESLVKLHFSAEEKKDILAFLASLTGKPLPAALLKAPSKP